VLKRSFSKICIAYKFEISSYQRLLKHFKQNKKNCIQLKSPTHQAARKLQCLGGIKGDVARYPLHKQWGMRSLNTFIPEKLHFYRKKGYQR